MKSRFWVLVLVAMGLLLALPTGAAARRAGPRGPSPQKFVAAAILVHNSFANSIQDEFAGPDSNYATELELCHWVEDESGEPREGGEQTLRENAASNLRVADSFKKFNSDLPLWARTFKALRSRLRRADRKKLIGAVNRIARAHTAHQQEFYRLRGVWVQTESVKCAAAAEEERKAKAIGNHAWVQEFMALVEIAHLFKVKKPPVEYPVGPYTPPS